MRCFVKIKDRRSDPWFASIKQTAMWTLWSCVKRMSFCLKEHVEEEWRCVLPVMLCSSLAEMGDDEGQCSLRHSTSSEQSFWAAVPIAQSLKGCRTGVGSENYQKGPRYRDFLLLLLFDVGFNLITMRWLFLPVYMQHVVYSVVADAISLRWMTRCFILREITLGTKA
jgi:hypothetical protein